MRSIIAALLSVFVASVPVFAHEGHVHKLMGTVTAVHADKGHVELKDAKGATQSFYVVKETRIVKGKDPVALADLKAGTRIVVEARTTDGRLVASEVRVGGSQPAAAAEHKH